MQSRYDDAVRRTRGLTDLERRAMQASRMDPETQRRWEAAQAAALQAAQRPWSLAEQMANDPNYQSMMREQAQRMDSEKLYAPLQARLMEQAMQSATAGELQTQRLGYDSMAQDAQLRARMAETGATLASRSQESALDRQQQVRMSQLQDRQALNRLDVGQGYDMEKLGVNQDFQRAMAEDEQSRLLERMDTTNEYNRATLGSNQQFQEYMQGSQYDQALRMAQQGQQFDMAKMGQTFGQQERMSQLTHGQDIEKLGQTQMFGDYMAGQQGDRDQAMQRMRFGQEQAMQGTRFDQQQQLSSQGFEQNTLANQEKQLQADLAKIDGMYSRFTPEARADYDKIQTGFKLIEKNRSKYSPEEYIQVRQMHAQQSGLYNTDWQGPRMYQPMGSMPGDQMVMGGYRYLNQGPGKPPHILGGDPETINDNTPVYKDSNGFTRGLFLPNGQFHELQNQKDQASILHDHEMGRIQQFQRLYVDLAKQMTTKNPEDGSIVEPKHEDVLNRTMQVWDAYKGRLEGGAPAVSGNLDVGAPATQGRLGGGAPAAMSPPVPDQPAAPAPGKALPTSVEAAAALLGRMRAMYGKTPPPNERQAYDAAMQVIQAYKAKAQ